MKNIKKTLKITPSQLSILASKKEASYDADFFKWTKTQVRLLKKQEFSSLDIENLIEEIESLGRSEKRTLQSYLEVLLMHMLKVKYQPKKHTRSWEISIKDSSHKAQKTLSENPSLKSKLKAIVEDAYFSARLKASLETTLKEETFPEHCPWTLKELFPNLEKKYC